MEREGRATGWARGRQGGPARFGRAALGLALGLAGACSPATGDVDQGTTSLYAEVEGIDGVFFYPPLGPTPTPRGTFDATLLDGIAFTIEAEDTDGAVTPLATFDRTTRPAVALLGPAERYWVNIPAATYLTDQRKNYRIRALLDGAEIGSSLLTAHVFDVLAHHPSLSIGVHLRVEGSGAVRAVQRSRDHVDPGTLPLHCSDGVRNKDEAGVDCGGRCRPCPTCSDGVLNQGEEDVDCGGPCTPCPTCSDGLRNQGEQAADCGGPCSMLSNRRYVYSNGRDIGWGSSFGEIGALIGYQLTTSTTRWSPARWSSSTFGSGCASITMYGYNSQNVLTNELGYTICATADAPRSVCPTCTDRFQNQGEQAVDCGGPCSPCPSCSDGIQNQGEIGVDCGGPCGGAAMTYQYFYQSNGQVIGWGASFADIGALIAARNALVFPSLSWAYHSASGTFGSGLATITMYGYDAQHVLTQELGYRVTPGASQATCP